MTPNHSEHSRFREKLLEHLVVGEILRDLWRRGVMNAEFLKPEVDDGGYDLVIALGKVIRHIQFKSSHMNAKTARQTVNIRLAEKQSGCVVWIRFDEDSLKLVSFRWFGGNPGSSLPDIISDNERFPIAKHSKGNAEGKKNERPNMRVVAKSEFDELPSIAALVERLFGDLPVLKGQE